MSMEDHIRALLEASEAKKQTEQTNSQEPWAGYTGAGHDDHEDIPVPPEHSKSQYQIALDAAIDNLDIISAYRRFTPKMVPKPGNKTEGIMISCPIPGHVDRTPSAWINTDKQLWKCGACDTGGDKLDIAAIGLGLWPRYKEKSEFPVFKEQLGEALGIRRDDYNTEPEPVSPATWARFVQEDEPAPEPVPEPVQKVFVPVYDPSEHTNLPKSPMPFNPDDADVPRLDWRSIVTPGTFLEAYMAQGILDDAPEEYHFWHGMMCLSAIAGINIKLVDVPPVRANMFLCILGPTGAGKSKSAQNMYTVLSDPKVAYAMGKLSGVRMTSTPNSELSLINDFQVYEKDPNNPKAEPTYFPVKGLVEFSEMSTLVSTSNRSGSRLTPYLQNFFDCKAVVDSNARTTGLVRAVNPHCCVLSTTQPGSLKTLYSQSDEVSGFLNRWLFVGGPRKIKPSFINEFTPDLTEACDLFKIIHDWSKFERLIKLTPEALKILTEFDNTVIMRDKAHHGEPFTRMDLYMKKIAMILAINERSLVVSEAHAKKTMQIYPYLKAFLIQRSQSMNSNEFTEMDDWIENYVRTTNKPMLARDIFRKLPNQMKKQGMERVHRALETLVKSGSFTKEKEVRTLHQRGVLKEYYMTHEMARLELAAGNIQPKAENNNGGEK